MYGLQISATAKKCHHAGVFETGNEDLWSNSPIWMKDTMENFTKPTDWKNITNILRSKTCLLVTDGSYDLSSKLVTAYWIIEGKMSSRQAKAAAQTPGNSKYMDAYRAELYIMYCILRCINTICSKFSLHEDKLAIDYDCDSTLFQALKYQQWPTTSQPNFDIIWEIFDLRQDINIDSNYVKMKGHQDTAKLGHPLACIERLNWKSNAGAKEYLQYIKRFNIQPIDMLYRRQWQLQHKFTYIYTKLKENIVTICHGDPLRLHIMKKRGYSDCTFNTIDWDAILDVGKASSVAEQTWLTKHVGLHNLTGRQLFW